MTVLKAELAGHEPAICYSDKAGFVLATRSDETPRSTRNTVYDAEAERFLREKYPEVQCNGNAFSQAEAMGWGLQEPELGKHIAERTPSYSERWKSWVKTDSKRRDTGNALTGKRKGDYFRIETADAFSCNSSLGWRGALRVNFAD